MLEREVHPALSRVAGTQEATSTHLLRKWMNPELTLVFPVQSFLGLAVDHLSPRGDYSDDSSELLLCLIRN